jgi:hypothetical protein
MLLQGWGGCAKLRRFPLSVEVRLGVAASKHFRIWARAPQSISSRFRGENYFTKCNKM